MTASLPGRLRALAAPYAALRLAGQAAEFVGFVLLARSLGPDAFGQLAIAFLVCRYAGLIGDWGALTRGSRDVAADGRFGSVHSMVARRTRTTLVAAGVVAAGMVATGWAELLPVVAVVLALGMSRDWVALGRRQAVRGALPVALQGSVLVVGALAADDLAGGALAVGAAYLVALVTSIAVNRLGPAPDGPAGRGPDAWILVASLAIQLTSSGDTILVGWLLGAADAGVYAALYRLPNAWVALLSAVAASSLPLATQAVHHRGAEADALGRRALRSSGLSALGVAGFAPVAAWALPLVFGASYDTGQAALVVLVLATAVITWAVPLHVLNVAGGDDRRYGLVMAGAAVGNIALNLVLIPTAGLVGAATATLITQVALAAVLWRQWQRWCASQATPAPVDEPPTAP